jgi:hypothetical protein
MKRWMIVALCTLMAYITAANATDVRKTTEATMLVTGSIEVAPDGSVHDYSIDRPEKLPPPVVDLLKKSVPGWKFEFTQTPDVIQRAKMSLRIVAKPVDDQHFGLHIIHANFGDPAASASEHVTRKDGKFPRYPEEAIREHVDGTVFLLLRIDRQGKVQDIAVEQVNLGAYGREAEMRHFRNLFGNAAMDAIKGWTFNPPTTGKHVSDPYWDVHMPVEFNAHPLGAPVEDTYGKWEAYIPGPRELIPWSKNNQVYSPDAIPAGSISQADQSLRLKTALDGA